MSNTVFRKMLVAGFFAVILLLMPLNTVVGTNELATASNKNNEVSVIGTNELLQSKLQINAQKLAPVYPQMIPIEELIAQIQSAIDLTLQYFGDSPEVVAICQQITDILNSYGLEIFCAFLSALFLTLFMLIIIIGDILPRLGISEDFIQLLFLLNLLVYFFVGAFFITYCDDVPPLAANFLLISPTNFQTLSKFDASVLESIVERASSVRGCQCGE